MDWSRGLLRVCALLGVFWVILVLAGSYNDWPTERESEILSEYVEASALFAFLPPLIVIAFGYCVLWAGHGFRRDTGSQAPAAGASGAEPRTAR